MGIYYGGPYYTTPGIHFGIDTSPLFDQKSTLPSLFKCVATRRSQPSKNVDLRYMEEMAATTHLTRLLPLTSKKW